MVDKNGNVISQQIDSGSTTPTGAITTTTQALTTTTPATTNPATTNPATTNPATTQPATIATLGGGILSSIGNIFGSAQEMPSTTFPAMSTSSPGITLVQTLDTNRTGSQFCASSDLNTPFREYNSDRVRGRNESNFPNVL
jgi:hypothetical protein